METVNFRLSAVKGLPSMQTGPQRELIIFVINNLLQICHKFQNLY